MAWVLFVLLWGLAGAFLAWAIVARYQARDD